MQSPAIAFDMLLGVHGVRPRSGRPGVPAHLMEEAGLPPPLADASPAGSTTWAALRTALGRLTGRWRRP